MRAALVAALLCAPQVLASQSPGAPDPAELSGRCIPLPETLLFCAAGTLWEGETGGMSEDRFIGFAGDVGLLIQVFPAEGVTPPDTLRAELNALAEAIIGRGVAGFVPLVEDRPHAGEAAVRFAWLAGADAAPEVSALTYAAWPGAIAVVHTSVPGDTYFTESHAMRHDAALMALKAAE